MVKVKEAILGLVVGCIAFFIYVLIYGTVAAYIPISYQNMTEGMTQERAVFAIHSLQVFEHFLAALPMATAAYVFMSIFKFKASILFLVSSLAIFCGNYFYTIYDFGNMALNITVVIPSLLLWFALSAPTKSSKKDAPKRASS